jgi:chromosome segregation ATPase
MQVPGGLLEIGWEALEQAVSRQARLKKSQRELTQKLDGHEQETDALQETFVRTAQDVYERMSAGEITGDKAEKKVSAEAGALKERLLELQAERADVERRLEALRRSLEASEGEIESVLKAGAPEQSLRLAETILGAIAELESKVFSALAEGRKVRESYFALQTLQRFQGRNLAWSLRQIGAGGSSFGSVPEARLSEALQASQEIGAVVEQNRAAAEAGEDVPEHALGEDVPEHALGEAVTVTRSGTVGVITDD